MKREQVTYIWFSFIALLILSLSVFFFFQKPTIIGYVLYEEKLGVKNWTFDSAADHSFDNSLINLSDGEVKLIKNIIEYTLSTENFTEIYITSALEYGPGKKTHDRTSKVQNLDNEGVEIHKNKDIFDVTFAKEIANNDIISLYILDTDEDETISISIYLCSNGTFCNNSNYGTLNFNGSKGWYNITVTGLDTNKSIFNINPTQNVEIDYVKGLHKDIIISKYTDISYPRFASIETKDFDPTGLASFSDFTKNELLNSQNLAYYYSADSGNSWNVMPSNINISIGSGKVRIAVNLSGNGTETPIVYDFSILYSTKVCKENWNVTYGACLSNDRRLKYYLDKNDCGTSKDIPLDNGTYEICDYDNNPPNVTNLAVNPKYGNIGILINISLNISDENEINSAVAYIQNPDEKDVKIMVLANDSKNTFSSILSTENMSEGIYLIDILANDSNNNRREYENIGIIALASHVKAAFTNSSLSIRQEDKYQIDAKETANALLELKTKFDMDEGAISVAYYSKNLYNLITNLSEFGKYLDIIADNKIKQNLSFVMIRIYYTEQEIINSSLDEETLEIHYFNETSNKWEALNSTVNASGNYVEATLEHLSTFGVFGKKTEIQTPSGSSSGSSGGSATIIPEPKKEEQKKVESIKESPAEEVIEKKLETYNGSLIFDVSTQNKTFEETVNIKVSVLKPSKYVFGLKSIIVLVFVLISVGVLYFAYRKINKRTEI